MNFESFFYFKNYTVDGTDSTTSTLESPRNIPYFVKRRFLRRYGDEQLGLKSVLPPGNLHIDIKAEYLLDILTMGIDFHQLKLTIVQIKDGLFDANEFPHYANRIGHLHIYFSLVNENKEAVSDIYDLDKALSAKKIVPTETYNNLKVEYETNLLPLLKPENLNQSKSSNLQAVYIDKDEIMSYHSNSYAFAQDYGNNVHFENLRIEFAQVDESVLIDGSTAGSPEAPNPFHHFFTQFPGLVERIEDNDNMLTLITTAHDQYNNPLSGFPSYDVAHLCPPGCDVNNA